MRRISVTALCNASKCERQALLKIRTQGERQTLAAKKQIAAGIHQHAQFSQEDLGGSRCFIASFAFGSDAPETQHLRHWRDSVLLGHPLGRIFTQSYYRFSPLLIRLIRPIPFSRQLARFLLRCFIRSFLS